VTNAVRVYGYVRVSTDEQHRSGLGEAAQRAAIENYVRDRGWTHVELCEEIASGGAKERPLLSTLLGSLALGDALVVARLDRLTRSLVHFASVVEAAKDTGWSLVVVDQGFDLSTPAGRAMAGMCAVFASYERELIAQRTSQALRALPRDRRNGQPTYADAVRRRAHELHDLGMSLRSIASVLLAEGVAPVRGGATLHASAVSRMLEEDVPAV
jgi:DNA invertase Pin-like site-specific DNA recombinase